MKKPSFVPEGKKKSTLNFKPKNPSPFNYFNKTPPKNIFQKTPPKNSPIPGISFSDKLHKVPVKT